MYFLSAAPDLSTKESTFATWENGFSESEIARVIVAGELYSQAPAVLGNDKTIDENVRKSLISWIPQTNENIWLYDKIGWIVNQLNGQFFNFDLTGFGEQFQYTVYHNDGGHYDWHMDKGHLSQQPRKLSLTIQLSDPSEYEGGDLEIMEGNKATKMGRTKGLVVAFPSWILHRVTPVTAGTRRSLVVWTGGPRFR